MQDFPRPMGVPPRRTAALRPGNLGSMCGTTVRTNRYTVRRQAGCYALDVNGQLHSGYSTARLAWRAASSIEANGRGLGHG